MQIAAVGLYIGESAFQVHGVAADGSVLVSKKLTRGRLADFFATLPRCLVGIVACSYAHPWARTILALGHDVRLLIPLYSDRRLGADAVAKAICEAVRRMTASEPYSTETSRSI